MKNLYKFLNKTTTGGYQNFIRGSSEDHQRISQIIPHFLYDQIFIV